MPMRGPRHEGISLYALPSISNSYPQLGVRCDVEWRPLNYALKFDATLLHLSDSLVFHSYFAQS